LDAAAARVLGMLASAPKIDGAAISASSQREALRRLATLASDPPNERVVSEDMTGAGLPLRVYRSDDPGQGLVIYLHGGGWVAGDLQTHDGVCRALAADSGCEVIAVDYRRPPEHPFPAPVEDAADVVDWARAAHPGAWLALTGDSAGGNIAACALGVLRARGSPPLDLLLLFCPILDTAPNTPSRRDFAEGYFIDERQFARNLADYVPDPTSAAASPLHADLTGHPPTVLHLAEYDPFRDEGLAYAERLRAAGVAVQTHVHPGMIHYFYALPKLIPYARSAVADAARHVRSSARETVPAAMIETP
jgi:acetyl esterase/lipase